MKTYRVLIADDHPLSREAIRSLLEGDSAFDIIGEATDGEEALLLTEKLQPDLVLMDINMPKLDGLLATKQIKRHYPHIRIVILSVSDDVADLFAAIQYGAQGYLLKNLDPDDWLSYLHALLDGNSDFSRELAGRMLHSFKKDEMKDEPSPSVLTPRELEILSCVAAGDTNKQIGERLVITENTVKNHMKNILEKLQVENRVQLAAYAVRNGIFVNREEP
ncbi:response regulator [Brevibacillus ginsengisoli]|uniref:response regulator n=1 Tax=Brevibacillus ginsengisoli TaxID=363854 RepID=UPI003CE7573C